MGQRGSQKLQCVVAYEVLCKNNEHLDLFRFRALAFLKGIKLTLEQAMKAQRGSRSVALIVL
jgi:hypothetical protein